MPGIGVTLLLCVILAVIGIGASLLSVATTIIFFVFFLVCMIALWFGLGFLTYAASLDETKSVLGKFFTAIDVILFFVGVPASFYTVYILCPYPPRNLFISFLLLLICVAVGVTIIDTIASEIKARCIGQAMATLALVVAIVVITGWGLGYHIEFDIVLENKQIQQYEVVRTDGSYDYVYNTYDVDWTSDDESTRVAPFKLGDVFKPVGTPQEAEPKLGTPGPKGIQYGIFYGDEVGYYIFDTGDKEPEIEVSYTVDDLGVEEDRVDFVNSHLYKFLPDSAIEFSGQFFKIAHFLLDIENTAPTYN